jgi:uncharacterized phage protein (TIGR02218 family)
MKPASTTLINYLNAIRAAPDAVMLMADAFEFTLANGSVLGYTNVDVSFAYNGTRYAANSVRIDGLKFKQSIGLDVDSQQISVAALSTDTITGGAAFLQALRNRAFDGCRIARYRVFFSDTIGGTVVGGVLLFQGRLGTIDEIGRTTAKLTVNSDLVLLDNDMPRNLYQPTCLHTLYDSGCTLAKASFGTNGVVGAGSTFSQINWSGASASFAQGTITFSSGVNSGVTATIGSALAGVALYLIYPLQSAPAAGDAFTVYFGCDHTEATCNTKFNNLANFRGFPFVPPPQMAV